MPDKDKPAETVKPEADEAPSSTATSVMEPPEDAAPEANPLVAWAVVIGLAIYAGFLSSLAIDEVFDIGWYPTQLEKQVRGQIAQLTAADEETRKKAREELIDGEMFVVAPELIRKLNSDSPEMRSECYTLLAEITPERLNFPASIYNPEAPPEARSRGRAQLWRWWKSVEYDFY